MVCLFGAKAARKHTQIPLVEVGCECRQLSVGCQGGVVCPQWGQYVSVIFIFFWGGNRMARKGKRIVASLETIFSHTDPSPGQCDHQNALSTKDLAEEDCLVCHTLASATL